MSVNEKTIPICVLHMGIFSGAPDRSRTCGLKSRSLALYPAELRTLISETAALSPFCFGQYRTKLVVQMRRRVFRQIVQKYRRHTAVCQGISVQDDGKHASRCAAKPSGALCAVLPLPLSYLCTVWQRLVGEYYSRTAVLVVGSADHSV